MIEIGNLSVESIFVGNAEVKSIWLGNVKIYENNAYDYSVDNGVITIRNAPYEVEEGVITIL